MAERVYARFALMPEVFDEVFTADALGRLARSVEIPDLTPLAEFRSPRARAALAEADILITGWGCPPLDSAALDAAPRLRAVIHAAGSVKQHVGTDALERGLAISSAALANMQPVAEYTVAMCVLAAKRALTLARAYSDGADVHSYVPGRSPSLYRSTVGIIGASRVGRLVMRQLADFNVTLLVYDPYLTDEAATALGARRVGLRELCTRSDIVSIHAPELPETYRMIGHAELAALRDGAVLINTARGSLIDTVALTEHCAAGRIDAVLDVSDPEPLPADHRLLHLPNVIVTPHIAGAKGSEVSRLGDFAVDEIERFVAGRELRGRVTATEFDRIA
jgi:phosphoglycerate dehydrogenase-like enzyme